MSVIGPWYTGLDTQKKSSWLNSFSFGYTVYVFSLDDNALKHNRWLILISFIVLQTDEKERRKGRSCLAGLRTTSLSRHHPISCVPCNMSLAKRQHTPHPSACSSQSPFLGDAVRKDLLPYSVYTRGPWSDERNFHESHNKITASYSVSVIPVRKIPRSIIDAFDTTREFMIKGVFANTFHYNRVSNSTFFFSLLIVQSECII